jgi:benzoylformate decarboxylase
MRTLDAAPLFLQLAAEPNGARGEAATAEWVRVWESLTKDLIIVDEDLTSAVSLMSYFLFRDGNSFDNVNAGIGWGIAAAAGVQIAEPARRVMALIGEGSVIYSTRRYEPRLPRNCR